MRVLLYAEYGLSIGAGHLMRSMALASAFSAIGVEAFLCASSHDASATVRDRGLNYAGTIVDDSVLGGFALSLGRQVSLMDFDLLVVDSYEVSDYDLESLNSILPVAYFDDMQDSRWSVSAVINGNITCDRAGYERRYSASGVDLLIGSEYCVLRDEFSERREMLPLIERRRILLMTGGSDLHDASYEISAHLLRSEVLGDLELHVVAGSLNPNISRLRDLEILDPRLHVSVDVRRVSDIMASCRCALSAGGTTLNELCAVGVPSLAFSLADNQDRCVEVFSREGASLSLGTFSDPGFYLTLDSALSRLLNDSALLDSMSTNGRRLFDGFGAHRIAVRLRDEVAVWSDN